MTTAKFARLNPATKLYELTPPYTHEIYPEPIASTASYLWAIERGYTVEERPASSRTDGTSPASLKARRMQLKLTLENVLGMLTARSSGWTLHLVANMEDSACATPESSRRAYRSVLDDTEALRAARYMTGSWVRVANVPAGGDPVFIGRVFRVTSVFVSGGKVIYASGTDAGTWCDEQLEAAEEPPAITREQVEAALKVARNGVDGVARALGGFGWEWRAPDYVVAAWRGVDMARFIAAMEVWLKSFDAPKSGNVIPEAMLRREERALGLVPEARMAGLPMDTIEKRAAACDEAWASFAEEASPPDQHTAQREAYEKTARRFGTGRCARGVLALIQRVREAESATTPVRLRARRLAQGMDTLTATRLVAAVLDARPTRLEAVQQSKAAFLEASLLALEDGTFHGDPSECITAYDAVLRAAEARPPWNYDMSAAPANDGAHVVALFPHGLVDVIVRHGPYWYGDGDMCNPDPIAFMLIPEGKR